MPRPADRKPRFDRLKTFERSMRAFQDNGILVLGGLGYAADRWLGTSPWCMVAGLVLGIVVGFYALIMSTRQGQP